MSYRQSPSDPVQRTVRISRTGAVSQVLAGRPLWSAGIDDDGRVVGVARTGACVDPADPTPCQETLVAVGADDSVTVLADVPDSYPAEPMVLARSKPYTAGTVPSTDGRLTSYLWHDDGTATPLQLPAGTLYAVPFGVNSHGSRAAPAS